MATLKGKWRFNKEIVLLDSLDEFVCMSCVYKCGDIDMLSDPEDINYTFGIAFNKNKITMNGTNVYSSGWNNYEYYSIIDFGDKERYASNKFYELFTANATPVIDEKELITISYGDKQSQNIEPGTITTIKTKDTVLKENIVVNVPKYLQNHNIYCGDTAPDDKTKVWIKTNFKPKKIEIKTNESFSDTVTKKTYSEPDMPLYMAIARVNNIVYMFGGFSNSTGVHTKFDDVYTFNIETEELTKLSIKLPKLLSDATAIAVNDYIYIFGGMYKTSSTDTYNRYNRDLFIFNTKNNTFNTISYDDAGLSNVHSYSCAYVLVGAYVYIFSETTKNIYVFNTRLNYVEQVLNVIPSSFVHYMPSFSTVVNNKIYLFGMCSGQKDVMIFDVSTHRVQTLTYENNISPIGGFTKGNLIYMYAANSYIIDGVSYDTPEIIIFNTDNNKVTRIPINVNIIDNGTVYFDYFEFNFFSMYIYSFNTVYNVERFLVPREIGDGTLQITIDKFVNKDVLILGDDTIEMKFSIKQILLCDNNNNVSRLKYAIYENDEWVEYE